MQTLFNNQANDAKKFVMIDQQELDRLLKAKTILESISASGMESVLSKPANGSQPKAEKADYVSEKPKANNHFNSFLFFGNGPASDVNIWADNFTVTADAKVAHEQSSSQNERSRSTNRSSVSSAQDLNSGSAINNNSFNNEASQEKATTKKSKEEESLKAYEEMIGDDLLKMIDSESSGSHEEEVAQAPQSAAPSATNNHAQKAKSSDIFVRQLNEQINMSESKAPQLARAAFVPEQTFNSIYSQPEAPFAQANSGFRQSGYTSFEAPTVMQSQPQFYQQSAQFSSLPSQGAPVF
mmetsp:Transcript_1009/g.1816  ORF Transcript_1009/g.1816 Transcript_1009/m.1816 type:complete len:296 (+) Transcript_1009:63-950(+)